MITKETKIDILSRYCADQIGHGMREKVYDVIKHVVDFLESDRASEVGVNGIVMPKIAGIMKHLNNLQKNKKEKVWLKIYSDRSGELFIGNIEKRPSLITFKTLKGLIKLLSNFTA